MSFLKFNSLGTSSLGNVWTRCAFHTIAGEQRLRGSGCCARDSTAVTAAVRVAEYQYGEQRTTPAISRMQPASVLVSKRENFTAHAFSFNRECAKIHDFPLTVKGTSESRPLFLFPVSGRPNHFRAVFQALALRCYLIAYQDAAPLTIRFATRPAAAERLDRTASGKVDDKLSHWLELRLGI